MKDKRNNIGKVLVESFEWVILFYKEEFSENLMELTSSRIEEYDAFEQRVFFSVVLSYSYLSLPQKYKYYCLYKYDFFNFLIKTLFKKELDNHFKELDVEISKLENKDYWTEYINQINYQGKRKLISKIISFVNEKSRLAKIELTKLGKDSMFINYNKLHFWKEANQLIFSKLFIVFRVFGDIGKLNETLLLDNLENKESMKLTLERSFEYQNNNIQVFALCALSVCDYFLRNKDAKSVSLLELIVEKLYDMQKIIPSKSANTVKKVQKYNAKWNIADKYLAIIFSEMEKDSVIEIHNKQKFMEDIAEIIETEGGKKNLKDAIRKPNDTNYNVKISLPKEKK